MSSVKQFIKENARLKRLALWLMRVFQPLSPPGTAAAILRYPRFVAEWLKFRRAGGRAAMLDWYPCLFDRTTSTAFDTHYLYQAAWAARHLYEAMPARHVDVGSDLRFVTQLAAFTEVEFIDIRPPEIQLQGFTVRPGSITQLPYADGSVASLSSMHVIEHIGLGRYGDPILADGPDCACREIVRVLASGGHAYVSTPVGSPKVGFNSQYVFDPREFARRFTNCEVVHFGMVDTDGTFSARADLATAAFKATGSLDYGLGLYVLRKK